MFLLIMLVITVSISIPGNTNNCIDNNNTNTTTTTNNKHNTSNNNDDKYSMLVIIIVCMNDMMYARRGLAARRARARGAPLRAAA